MNITKMSHEHTKDAIRTQQLKPTLPVIIFTRHVSKYWLRVKVTCLAGWVYSSTTVLVLFCSFCCVWDWDFCLTPSLWTGPLAAPWWWWSQVCRSCTTWIPIHLLPPFLCGRGIAFVVHESLCPHLITTADFPFQHSSFELAHLSTFINTVYNSSASTVCPP